MEKFKRIFVVVLDSLGVGAMPDAEQFGDAGANTLGRNMSQCVGTCISKLFRIRHGAYPQ